MRRGEKKKLTASIPNDLCAQWS